MPPLLGMTKVVGEDSARNALKAIEVNEGIAWLQKHLYQSYDPLLELPWILDADVTIKTLYGHQEGAAVGYNPHKPGRSSHTYPTYMIANVRLILEVEVQAGNRSSSAYTAPGLWILLGRIPRARWPAFIRSDSELGKRHDHVRSGTTRGRLFVQTQEIYRWLSLKRARIFRES